MRDIHLSIVSHGHAHYLARLFADLAAMPSAHRYQVTLVMNIPHADRAFLQAVPFPVGVIDNARPQGFGHNHNMAFRAPPLGAERAFFVVLNPDVRLQGDVLAVLAGRLRDNPHAGVIAPRVVSPHGVPEDSARELPTLPGLIRKALGRSGAWQAPPGDAVFSPDWVAGICMLFPQQLFAQLGGFDEGYYLYYEDVDICSRLRLAGYSVLVDPTQTIVHDAQRSSRRQWRYARWHLLSVLRFLRSDVYRQVQRLPRRR
jgi:N-acetylglucosaminyl-diphospho-decaprenol L-rhamnosyltransferase